MSTIYFGKLHRCSSLTGLNTPKQHFFSQLDDQTPVSRLSFQVEPGIRATTRRDATRLLSLGVGLCRVVSVRYVCALLRLGSIRVIVF